MLATAVDAASLAPNTVEITPRLVTAGQPSRDTLARLREQGFGAVIYLAPPTLHDALQDEPVILNRQSIAFVNIPIEFERPMEADYEVFTHQMKKPGDRKLLVHCQANLRASSMVFLYRVIELKEDPHKAYGREQRLGAERHVEALYSGHVAKARHHVRALLAASEMRSPAPYALTFLLSLLALA
ncbi:MAG: protein tyrosine phosphatase family protein, partial [Casimicrobiaceae bacterium]